MRSRHLLLAAVAFAAVMSLAAVVGTLLEWWWLVALAGAGLLSATLLAAVDTDRRVRELRSYVRAQVASIDTTGGRAAPTQEDVVGTVRALQAQYTGRLDRLQDTVEQSLRRDGGHAGS